MNFTIYLYIVQCQFQYKYKKIQQLYNAYFVAHTCICTVFLPEQ